MGTLAAREHDALIAAFSALAEVSAPGWVRGFGGVVAAVSGSRLAFFNQVMVASEATAAEMDEALSAVAASGTRCVVTLRQGVDDHLAESTEKAGMTPPEHLTPGMAWQPEGQIVLETPLAIRSGADVLDDHITVATAGFGLPPDILPVLLSDDLAQDWGFTFYTGYLDGDSVACSAGFIHAGSVSVFNVATLPDHRGRGYGAAMTLAAVRDGIDRGADVAFLQSSRMGLGVYRRLGFETVVEYGEWASPKGTS